MSNFNVVLRHLERELRIVLAMDEYAIFGSTSLILQNVLAREPGDIDVFVSRRVWGSLLTRPGWEVQTPKAGDPPILHFPSVIPLNLFFDWSDRYVQIDVKDLLERAGLVKWDGFEFRCIPVEDALAHKKGALKYSSSLVAKHLPDIEIIEEYLAREHV